jgi:hypothetical protein
VTPDGEDTESGEEPSYANSAPVALWKASRNIRIKALKMRPLLVDRLIRATDEALEVIEQAKEIGIDRGILN